MANIWWQTDSTGRRRLILRKCGKCPCEKGCRPKELAEFTVEPGEPCDLSGWTGNKVGYPGARWRLVEASDCYLYASGAIDENGKLEGLPASFTSDYAYQGRLRIQQGCPDEFGVVHWPEVSGCPSLNISN